MSGKKIVRAREALSNFIEGSHQEDEYFLIGFSSQRQLLLNKSRSGDPVTNKLSFVEPHESTALYDATYLALEQVERGVHQKSAIQIISDGQDNNSRYRFSQLRRVLKGSDALIYAFEIEGPTLGNVLGFYGKVLLSELVGSSGGRIFFPTGSTALRESEEIALELRQKYSTGYRLSNSSPDGKWHRDRVKVTAPQELKRVFVHSREAYFAVGPSR